MQRKEQQTLLHSPFFRSLRGGKYWLGCNESSLNSWATASLWGLGASRVSDPESSSASAVPKRSIVLNCLETRRASGLLITLLLIKLIKKKNHIDTLCFLFGFWSVPLHTKFNFKIIYTLPTDLPQVLWVCKNIVKQCIYKQFHSHLVPRSRSFSVHFDRNITQC